MPAQEINGYLILAWKHMKCEVAPGTGSYVKNVHQGSLAIANKCGSYFKFSIDMDKMLLSVMKSTAENKTYLQVVQIPPS